MIFSWISQKLNHQIVSVCFVGLSQSQGILYYFSIAIVIHKHILSSLKHFKFINSQSVGQKPE